MLHAALIIGKITCAAVVLGPVGKGMIEPITEGNTPSERI